MLELIADGFGRVGVGDAAVAPQQVTQRQVRGGLTVGDAHADCPGAYRIVRLDYTHPVIRESCKKGTLFGRNATGGAVRIMSKEPTPELDLQGDVLYGNFNDRQVRGVGNVPLIADRLFLRISGHRL